MAGITTPALDKLFEIQKILWHIENNMLTKYTATWKQVSSQCYQYNKGLLIYHKCNEHN